MKCHAGCDVPSICAALSIKPRDLFNDSSVSRRIVAQYPYRDADGTLLFEVVRFDPKDFRQRAPDRHGGWSWSIRGVPLVLYRLPELLAKPAADVYIVEGEKDAESLRALGLVATTNPMGAGKWKRVDRGPLAGRACIIVPDHDIPGIRHAREVGEDLSGTAASVEFLEYPAQFKDISDCIASGSHPADWSIVTEAPAIPEGADPTVPTKRIASPRCESSLPDSRPGVVLGANEHECIDACISILAEKDSTLFSRGGYLVRVMEDRGVLGIRQCPASDVRYRLAQHVCLLRESGPSHPPGWLVSGVAERGHWPGIRPLYGIAAHPILRPDGSIHGEVGYDAATSTIFHTDIAFPVHIEASAFDAGEALQLLLDVVCDFPFASDLARSVWLAGLLTPLARYSYTGPSPLFLVDANNMGVGKTLLCSVIGSIVTGRPIPVFGYVHDAEEMGKCITAIAVEAAQCVLLDNIHGKFGNSALERAVTSAAWKGRILGKSESVETPLLATWYATSNNAVVTSDMSRRTLVCRLEYPEEAPEARTAFSHPDLMSHVLANRGRLVSAALAILVAGRDYVSNRTLGGFEGWSRSVAAPIEALGLPNPIEAKPDVTYDEDRTACSQFLAALCDISPSGIAHSSADILRLAKASPDCDREKVYNLSDAIENVVGSPINLLSGKSLGRKLRSFVGRKVDGFILECQRDTHRNCLVYKVCKALPEPTDLRV